MEDYKKKYDELLLKLQKAKVDDNVCDEMYYRVIDDIVPELSESEDERIRKELICFMVTEIPQCAARDKYIALLEKQGKQVSAIRWYDASFIPQEYKELLVEWNSSDATWHDVAFYHADTKTFLNYERELKNVTRWCYVEDLYWEQSNVKGTGISQHDKKMCVENENSLTDKPQGKSNDINDKGYCFILKKQDKSALSYHEEKVDNTNNKVEPKFKDGDVLNSPSHHLIWIYRDNEHFYACVNMNYVTENVATDGLIKIPSDACLATKLQRDVLFEKMHEACYEWDAEKLELKKIEQKPVEWSEEDKSNIQEICKILDSSKKYFADCKEIMNYIDWLKSLKQRYTWKPSDEQIKAVRLARSFVVDDFGEHPTLSEILKELEEQLKKLK